MFDSPWIFLQQFGLQVVSASRRAIFSASSIFLFAISLAAQTPIPLWPDGAPNAIGKEPQDIPTITPFVAPKETATGASVLVLPGGGYTRLSDVKEGSDIAKWLNSLGISAFVLKYRLGPRYNQPNPLLDAARAMRTVRARSKEFGVDSNRIAILGFSAGGHLASTLGTHFDLSLIHISEPTRPY